VDTGGACGGIGVEQAASTPRIAAQPQPAGRGRRRDGFDMWVIVLEALAALAILVGIVWWTMFAGRRRGERRDRDGPA
jgi:hypothetical protein